METVIKVLDLSFFYGSRPILSSINVELPGPGVVALTGPSGAGKSTFLMTLNRLWEEVGAGRLEGRIMVRLDGEEVDIYSRKISLAWLRRKIGMVFQSPNPLPMSIYRNLSLPLCMAGWKEREAIRERIETSLQRAGLWNEVKDRLEEDARNLSGGQQQRLCIARALTLEPEILLLDEPASSLDEAATRKIETLLEELKASCTLIMVSHDQEQIGRVADIVLELGDGSLVTPVD